MAKSYTYSVLMSRMDEALEEEFYLEAAWLAYAVLEDRLVSALTESGGAFDSKGREFRMMGPKLGELIARQQEPGSVNLRKAFFGDMPERLNDWKEERNHLMHAMADETLSVADLDELAQRVAVTGHDLAHEFCSACQRFKKLNRKT